MQVHKLQAELEGQSQPALPPALAKYAPPEGSAPPADAAGYLRKAGHPLAANQVRPLPPSDGKAPVKNVHCVATTILSACLPSRSGIMPEVAVHWLIAWSLKGDHGMWAPCRWPCGSAACRRAQPAGGRRATRIRRWPRRSAAAGARSCSRLPAAGLLDMGLPERPGAAADAEHHGPP